LTPKHNVHATVYATKRPEQRPQGKRRDQAMANIGKATRVEGDVEKVLAYRDDVKARDHLEPTTGAESSTIQGLRHYEEERLINAPADEVFGHLDVFQNLAKHMAEPNWRMLWGWMRAEADEKGGQEVGSVVSLEGAVLGVKLTVLC
jgi:hypothetical protein